MNKKWILLTALLLAGCSSTEKIHQHVKQSINDAFSKDTRGLDILTSQFSHNIDRIWGVNELLVASRKDYVKYTDNYLTRSHISFDEGIITLGTQSNLTQLKNAIVHLLLMGAGAEGIDLFATGDVAMSKDPFLQDQVIDNKGKPIKTLAQAKAFAEELIRTKLQHRRLANGKTEQYVTIPMIANHIAVRAKKYLPLVRKASREYGIDESLILGIMQVESSFNPYAISYANAVGLMQVVPNTAGADVFKKLKGRTGKPSRKYLFDPKRNIDIGTGYLWLLHNNYLGGISDPISKRYAVISAYNSGSGAVLRIFDNDRNKAQAKINQLLPEQVYQILTTMHPSEQARNYLLKVDKAQKSYRRR